MKTQPSENANPEISRNKDLSSPTELADSNVPSEIDKQLDQVYFCGNDHKNSSESDSLIICNPELVARFQSPKTEKHKLNPGHYLQKVFLSSVAQKFKSQSLPNCCEKKKLQKFSNGVDNAHEVHTPLVQSTVSDPNSGSSDISNNQWFKTWPERGIDKKNDEIKEELDLNPSETDVLSNNSKRTLIFSSSPPSGIYSGEHSPKSISCSQYTPDVRLNTVKESQHKSEPFDSRSDKNNTNSHTNQEVLRRKTLDTSKTVPIEDLLNNISLAYSPITKQLHLIQPNSEKTLNTSNITSKENNLASHRNFNLEENTCDVGIIEKGKGDFSTIHVGKECEQLNTFQCMNTEVSSFSSTVSSLSDNSPSTNEDSALGSLLDHGDTCSLVSVGGCSAFSEESIGTKPKKKSLTGFFSKNVFNWKSGSRSEESGGNSGGGGGGGGGASWRLFGKHSSPQSSHPSLTGDQYNEVDAWSLAPDSPSSVRSSSSTGQKSFSHESRVASSSALIQLDRPANLPAKSEEEEARHRQEYQQMVEAARKKELKESKQRKKQMQLQLRAEEQLAQATRVWTREILPKWDQMHTSKKAKELWWQGVPPCVRGKVWQLAIGNPLNLTRSLYDICVQRAQDRLKTNELSCSEEDDSDNKEASMQVIQLDISRTFPHLCIFQKGGPYYDMLHCLLAAYVCYRPDVGYVQGMSFIAAVLILNMEAADAFVCFANLLNQPCHMAFFHLNTPLMQAYYFTYNELFKENLPQLYDHFTSTTLTPDLYLLDWLYTVFTKAMNLDLASRVWDVFLRDGEEFLFRTALGVLHLCQETLLQMDFVHGSQFLTRLPDDLSGDQLFKSISCIKMTVGKHTFESILSAHSVHCQ